MDHMARDDRVAAPVGMAGTAEAMAEDTGAAPRTGRMAAGATGAGGVRGTS